MADMSRRPRSSARPAGRAGGAPGGEQPRLLAGGNPQIPKGDGDGPVQAYIAAMPGWKRAVGRRLDALIAANVPGLQKAVRWNSPFYGLEGRGWFVSYHCFTHYVKVTFFRGISLDPPPPEPSRTDETRYLHVRDGDLDDPDFAAQFEDWVRQASALPGWSGS